MEDSTIENTFRFYNANCGERVFTKAGEDPFDTVEWELRDVIIKNDSTGKIVFDGKNLEFPKSWSQAAAQIVGEKYFRYVIQPDGSKVRETSVKQMISRVVDTIIKWGDQFNYFDSKYDERTGEIFTNIHPVDPNKINKYILRDELKYMLVHQMFSFNSPVWFNVGTKGGKVGEEGVSACYLLDVEDNMESILDLPKIEGLVYKSGSGAGVSYSKLRGKDESLSVGGTSSGPCSFMMKDDFNAGAIKSGGSTRRSAKLACLDVDHPDIEEFIETKAIAERAANALIKEGFSSDFRDRYGAYALVPFQNGNQSVSVSDKFMEAVEKDLDWNLIGRVDGKVIKTVRARDLWDKICSAAWKCGDPGLHFIDTVNYLHQTPNTSRVYTSNPCIRGNTLMPARLDDSVNGWFQISELANLCDNGHKVELSTGETLSPAKIWYTGVKPVVRVRYAKYEPGIKLADYFILASEYVDLTPEHKVRTFQEYDDLNKVLKAPTWTEAKECLGKFVNIHKGSKKEIGIVMHVEHLKGEYPVYDFRVEDASHCGVANRIVVHNCSEFFHIPWASCNLASINVYNFQGADLELEGLRKSVPFIAVAMNILIDGGGFPHPNFKEATHKVRPIGIGLTNLGAIIMSYGQPYDSDEGRTLAGDFYETVNKSALCASSFLSKMHGPFPEFDKNREACLSNLLSVYIERRDPLREVLSKYGVRNSQVTSQAPVGTISFMMDCATTGIEPELSLVKYKKLVGGNTIKIVNDIVEAACAYIGKSWEQTFHIKEYILDNNSVEGCEFLSDEEKEIFRTALPDPISGKSIAPMAHIQMMEVAQKHLSSAISKTVNMPSTTTTKDISDIYFEAWKRGLKSIAIYRDGCKSSQPLETAKKVKEINVPALPINEEDEKIINYFMDEQTIITTNLKKMASSRADRIPARRKLPDDCTALRHKFSVGGHEGYLHVGIFDDGSPGELFITMSKEGSTLAGTMDAFGVVTSMALQYGVPLSALVDKFKHTKFEPAGFTLHKEIKTASSIIDYIFRWLDHEFPDGKKNADGLPRRIDVEEAAPAVSAANSAMTGDMCSICGGFMVRTGACNTCTNCGVTGGCG
jgi:ribonucleotide reductase alpha subunit